MNVDIDDESLNTLVVCGILEVTINAKQRPVTSVYSLSHIGGIVCANTLEEQTKLIEERSEGPS